MVTFAQLRDAKPQLWITAAEDLRKAGRQCSRVEEDIHRNGVQPLDEHWPDHVGKLAVGALKKLAIEAEAVSILAGAGAEPVDALAHAVTIAQSELDSGVRLAEANRLTVDAATGAVSFPQELGQDNPTTLLLLQQQAQQMIDDAIEAATQADNICAEQLKTASGMAADHSTTPEQAHDAQMSIVQKSLEEIRDTLPDGLTATQVAAWWNGLTPKEQFDLERACPTELMSLNGIPDDVKKAIDRPELGYSSVGTVGYAKSNWDNRGLDWGGKDNCTNFVSTSLRYGGGMKTKDVDGWPWDHSNPDAWTDGGLGGSPAGRPELQSYSANWGGAQNNHDFFKNHGTLVTNPADVRPGDVVYWTSTQDSAEVRAGETHHAAIVTAVLPDGQVLYTQHTSPGRDLSLGGRLDGFEQAFGKQTIEIVRPRVTW